MLKCALTWHVGGQLEEVWGEGKGKRCSFGLLHGYNVSHITMQLAHVLYKRTYYVASRLKTLSDVTLSGNSHTQWVVCVLEGYMPVCVWVCVYVNLANRHTAPTVNLACTMRTPWWLLNSLINIDKLGDDTLKSFIFVWCTQTSYMPILRRDLQQYTFLFLKEMWNMSMLWEAQRVSPN